MFWKGPDGGLWHVYTTDSGSTWSAPGPWAWGVLGSTPFAAAQPDGTIDVFWRGSGSGHLWHAYYRAGHGWAGPQSLGADLYPLP